MSVLPERQKINREYIARPDAPTLDDIFAAVRDSKIVAAKNVLSLFKSVIYPKSEFASHIEQFNFGRLSYRSVQEAQSEAIDFIDHGLFSMPYKVCLYRVVVDYPDGIAVGVSLLIVDGEGDKNYPGNACVAFSHSRDNMLAMHSINMMRVVSMPEGRAVELQIPTQEWEFWQQTVQTEQGKKPDPIDFCDGAMLGMGLTMILNTKGVRKDRRAPAEKPNKARAKAGHPLLPWVTRVYTDVYNRAIAPGSSGTHASPRPHRRRAHVRHYPATDYRTEYYLPIAAMLVNWDGKPLEERNQYEVH